VYLRGLSTEQLLSGKLGSVVSTGLDSGANLDVDALLSESSARPVHDGVEGSLQRSAMPKCSPVLSWSHNRIECMIAPERVPKVSGPVGNCFPSHSCSWGRGWCWKCSLAPIARYVLRLVCVRS
jgi:hypothetical protein